MAEIVAIGEILVEILATEIGQSFLEPGLLRGPYPSGAPAIFADQAARMGCGTVLIGGIGDDDFGEMSLRRLRASGVDTRGIVRIPGVPTGTAFVTYRADGNRHFVFNIRHSASGGVTEHHVPAEFFEGCRFFHVSGSSLFAEGIIAAIRKGVRFAAERGAKFCLDLNCREELLREPGTRRCFDEMIGAADIVIMSEPDMAALFPGADETQATASLIDRGVECVIVKKAAKGSTYYDRDRRIETGGFPVKEVDPTGAGDCFGATFLAALAAGEPLSRALVLANAAGSLAVTKRGPMEGTGWRREIEARAALGAGAR